MRPLFGLLLLVVSLANAEWTLEDIRQLKDDPLKSGNFRKLVSEMLTLMDTDGIEALKQWKKMIDLQHSGIETTYEVDAEESHLLYEMAELFTSSKYLEEMLERYDIDLSDASYYDYEDKDNIDSV